MLKFASPPPGPFRFVPTGNGMFRRVERGAGGAYDAAGGLKTPSTDTPKADQTKYTPETARALFQFLQTRLSPSDLAEAWRRIEARVVDDRRPRGNGNGHAAHV